MTPFRTMRGRSAAVLAASALVLLSACSQDSNAEAGATTPVAATAPATETAAATEAAKDGFPAAIARDFDIDFGSAAYDRIAACHHDGPVTLQGGRTTFAPSNPSDELTTLGAEVQLSITSEATYLEIGPDGRSYASVPFSCKAVGGDTPANEETPLDSGELIVGGTQDDLQVVGLVTAGEPTADEPTADKPTAGEPTAGDRTSDGTSGAAKDGDVAGEAEATGASATDLELREPAGIGAVLLHSSLRNGDGYRYFIREEEAGDTDEPSGRSWTTVAWDEQSSSVRQLEHSDDILDTVPQPDKTLVVGVDGDDGILVGQEDLDDLETFEAIAAFMGDPDEESSEFAESGAHQGYKSETQSWGSFTVSYYSPADGEPDWVGTCLAWNGELSDFPPPVTIGSAIQLGSSLAQNPHLGSTEADQVEGGEAPSLVTDDGGRYTVDVTGGSRTDGMITSVTSGTGCTRG